VSIYMYAFRYRVRYVCSTTYEILKCGHDSNGEFRERNRLTITNECARIVAQSVGGVLAIWGGPFGWFE
jgi:hypothetical protein